MTSLSISKTSEVLRRSDKKSNAVTWITWSWDRGNVTEHWLKTSNQVWLVSPGSDRNLLKPWKKPQVCRGCVEMKKRGSAFFCFGRHDDGFVNEWLKCAARREPGHRYCALNMPGSIYVRGDKLIPGRHSYQWWNVARRHRDSSCFSSEIRGQQEMQSRIRSLFIKNVLTILFSYMHNKVLFEKEYLYPWNKFYMTIRNSLNLIAKKCSEWALV